MTAKEFIYATMAVRKCNRCVPSRDGTHPARADKAGTEAKVAVVVPLYGIPGERLLRALISELWRAEEVAYVPVRGCDGSQAACRSHYEAQLHSLSKLSVVLLVGGESVKSWRSDQTLARQQGKIGRMLDKWACMPVPHPDSVVKGFVKRDEYREMLRAAWEVSTGEVPGSFFLMDLCCVGKCEEEADEWDADEVGYCRKHWKTYGTKWKKDRKLWVEEKTVAMQPKLDLNIT